MVSFSDTFSYSMSSSNPTEVPQQLTDIDEENRRFGEYISFDKETNKFRVLQRFNSMDSYPNSIKLVKGISNLFTKLKTTPILNYGLLAASLFSNHNNATTPLKMGVFAVASFYFHSMGYLLLVAGKKDFYNNIASRWTYVNEKIPESALDARALQLAKSTLEKEYSIHREFELCHRFETKPTIRLPLINNFFATGLLITVLTNDDNGPLGVLTRIVTPILAGKAFGEAAGSLYIKDHVPSLPPTLEEYSKGIHNDAPKNELKSEDVDSVAPEKLNSFSSDEQLEKMLIERLGDNDWLKSIGYQHLKRETMQAVIKGKDYSPIHKTAPRILNTALSIASLAITFFLVGYQATVGLPLLTALTVAGTTQGRALVEKGRRNHRAYTNLQKELGGLRERKMTASPSQYILIERCEAIYEKHLERVKLWNHHTSMLPPVLTSFATFITLFNFLPPHGGKTVIFGMCSALASIVSLSKAYFSKIEANKDKKERV